MGIDSTKHNFLEGGGDMGHLIRAHDWSKTSLGDPSNWPYSLKAMVSMMLDNPFAMLISWGKDHTLIYNDGYRPILGSNKHPQALGNSIKDTFAEIWHITGPMYDKVLQGESVRLTDFMLPLDRNGYVENCYFNFAYSPIKLDSGGIGGVLVTVIETTAKKLAEDSLEDNKSELDFVIEASQLATFDYNPLTNKFSGNERLKKWFGLPLEEQIELSDAIEAIADKDKERVSKAIADALNFDSGGLYNEEYSIVNSSTHVETIVHAKGKVWFNAQREAYRLSGTLEDVTEQVLARQKIEESERSLRLMVLQAPVAIAICRGKDYCVEIANTLALELWGRTEQQVLHQPIFEALPELLEQGIKKYVDEVVKTGISFSTPEMPVQFLKNGILETVFINFSFEPLYDARGHINGIMAIGVNVTPQVEARKKLEESEQNIRALVESAPFPIGVYVGENIEISLANQSIMDAWGKGNDVIGKLYSDVLPELENQQIYEKIREVLRTGIPYHAKNQKVELFKNGELRPFYFNYSFTPLFDISGKPYAVMNTAAEVTELNEAKLKVEESEKRFRDTVKQAPLGIVIFRGPDHVIEMANQSYLQLIDRTEKQFVGKPLFETLPEVEDIMAPIITEIYTTGKPFYGYEFPVQLNRHGTTEVGYYNFVYSPLLENNSITGIMVVSTEVTASVKTKQLIKENEEKLELIIEASDLGVFDVNLQTGSLSASDRCYGILGYPIDSHNLRHEDVIANLHPEDRQIRKEAFELAYETGLLHYQSRVIWDDQSLHWIDAKGKVFYDAKNQPERLLGTVREITKERTFQEQLLEREEKFRLLADSMPQHVWTSDPEGKLNYFNQSVFDYSGLTLEQINTDGWLQIVHPEDREENIKRWEEAVRTGKDFLLEHRFRQHDGNYRWQLSRAIPQKDSDGSIKMWVGSSTDIQEQKMFTTELEHKVRQRTDELLQKNIDLEKMNKELQSFVYISSHDLQEPLRKIQIFSSRIVETDYDSLSETAKNYFGRMQKSASRMQNLIQDLIDYSRTNVKDIKYDHLDLLDIVKDVQETLSEELEQTDVTFNFQNLPKVRVVLVQFKQVLHNLISNSLKFAKAEQPLVIEISCGEVKGKNVDIDTLSERNVYHHIRFADNGIGFEALYNEKIFEVFQRLHSKDDYTGTGIGLAIVKRIIENHEGAILANGILGQGAVFDIYIPVA